MYWPWSSCKRVVRRDIEIGGDRPSTDCDSKNAGISNAFQNGIMYRYLQALKALENITSYSSDSSDMS
jgi:hypothetical protein